VDDASEIDEAWLDGVTTVGISSGASVPDVLVEGVLAWLDTHGFADVEVVQPMEESLTFSLPKELRRDLRAEASEAASAAETAGPATVVEK
jgi:4-hydroxy-3-methylbut-2-enyl diphosphate reductase